MGNVLVLVVVVTPGAEVTPCVAAADVVVRTGLLMGSDVS